MTSISARRFNISSRMVLLTMSTMPRPSMQPLHPVSVDLHGLHVGQRGDRGFEGFGTLRRARAQSRRHDQSVGQRILSEGIKRTAESGITAKLGERLFGGDDAHRGDVTALAQLLRERLHASGGRLL